jgi:hypothetical protein
MFSIIACISAIHFYFICHNHNGTQCHFVGDVSLFNFLQYSTGRDWYIIEAGTIPLKLLVTGSFAS